MWWYWESFVVTLVVIVVGLAVIGAIVGILALATHPLTARWFAVGLGVLFVALLWRMVHTA